MRLRYRQYQARQGFKKKRPKKPFHTSFTLFPKLPTEIRHMIWRLTLQPRTIEVREREDQAAYSCPFTLPSAMSTSQDSRAAVVGLYPFCFTSRSKFPSIRFNFALDTLYFGGDFDGIVFHLLDILTEQELSAIRHVAIDEVCGWDPDDSHAHPTFWRNLEKSLKAFTALQDVSIVLDIEITDGFANSGHAEHNSDYLCHFFDEYPSEFKNGNNERQFWLTERWNNSKLKLVWGWRLAKYPKYV